MGIKIWKRLKKMKAKATLRSHHEFYFKDAVKCLMTLRSFAPERCRKTFFWSFLFQIYVENELIKEFKNWKW